MWEYFRHYWRCLFRLMGKQPISHICRRQCFWTNFDSGLNLLKIPEFKLSFNLFFDPSKNKLYVCLAAQPFQYSQRNQLVFILYFSVVVNAPEKTIKLFSKVKIVHLSAIEVLVKAGGYFKVFENPLHGSHQTQKRTKK